MRQGKLNDAQKQMVVACRKEGMTIPAIAEGFNVCTGTIQRILRENGLTKQNAEPRQKTTREILIEWDQTMEMLRACYGQADRKKRGENE